MKKLLFIAAATLICIFLANKNYAQGLYVGVDAGYALKLASASMYTDNDYQKSEEKSFSLGNGFDAGIMVGYMLNKNIGAEVGVSYLFGGENSHIIIDYNVEGKASFRGNMLRLTPSVVVAAGFDKIDPYAKIGMIIGFGSIKFELTDTYDTGSIATEEIYKRKYNGGVAIGMFAALGADYKINENLAVFVEINGESLSYAPTKGKLTEYKINGVDQLGSMTTRQKEYVFVDEIDGGETIPDSDPQKFLKSKSPFSSIGLNVGVKFKL